jgi:S1-C subfamily serine protease
MQRRTVVYILLAAFVISLFTSVAAGAVAGVVAVRMSASDRTATRANGVPSSQVQPNPANPADPAQPNQRQPGQGRFGSGGALISEVVAGSPAEKAGVQVGDLVVSIGGQRLDATHSLDALVRQSKVGDTVELQLRRAGSAMQTVSVTLAASPNDPNTPYLGVRFGVAPAGNPTPAAPSG